MTKHSYKLIYFDLRGRAEAIRLIFHYFNVPFEDARLTGVEWAELKASSPFEHLPVLMVDDGKFLELAESTAIARYLAKSLKPESYFGGATKPEAALCDMYVDAINDVLTIFLAPAKAKTDEAKLQAEEHRDTAGKRKLELLSKHYVKNGRDYLVGKKVLWPDLICLGAFSILEDLEQSDAITALPDLAKYYLKMRDCPKIAEYIENHWPPTKVTAE